MTHDQIAARLRTLRDRTGEAVCLNSTTWLYTHGDACERTVWEVWVGAHRQHYPGPTVDAALSAAEDAVLFATAGDGT
jgi:hypothetical protein